MCTYCVLGTGVQGESDTAPTLRRARLGQYKVVDAVTGGPNPTQGSWGCREGELGFPEEAVCLSSMFKLRSGKEALSAVSAHTAAKEA